MTKPSSTPPRLPQKGKATMSKGHSLILVSMFLFSACAIFQPPPATVERNYEGDSFTKRVKIGHDLNLWPPLQESSDHARERLLADIQRECPRYRILAEGTDSQNHVGYKSRQNETEYFLWVRYRCER